MTKRQIKKQIKKLQKVSVFGLSEIKQGSIFFNGNSKYEITSDIRRLLSNIYVNATLTYGGKEYNEYALWIEDYNVINGGYNLYRLFKNKNLSNKYNLLIKKVSKYITDDDGEDYLEFSIPLSKGEIVDYKTIK